MRTKEIETKTEDRNAKTEETESKEVKAKEMKTKKKVSKTKTKEKLPKGITKCSDGRYLARYTFEGHRYSVYGRDLEELTKKLNDIRYEIEHDMYIKQEKITVDQWFHLWIEEYKSTTVKKGTIESYQSMYQYYIKQAIGKKPIADVKGENIQFLYNSLSRNGYSKATISLIHVLLGSMFRQALKNEIIQKNPVELATLPRGMEQKERRVLTVTEQELLLAECKENSMSDIILVALSTGARIGELTGLEWKDIDFERREITIQGTLKLTRDRTWMKDTPKTKSSKRRIPLLDKTREILLNRQKQQRISKEENSWKPEKGLENLIFLNENGKPFQGQYIRRQMIRLVDSINEKYPDQYFEYFTPHTLRHTFATRALENGIPPKVVQEILGHSSITMTLDLYTHVLPQTKATEMKKLEGMF